MVDGFDPCVHSTIASSWAGNQGFKGLNGMHDPPASFLINSQKVLSFCEKFVTLVYIKTQILKKLTRTPFVLSAYLR
jgi:hypothetical protein